ncbi:uncharacterized protein [Spinacia oleracea]|uniref:CCHC-type domain-containing protein n=1 Tax=Spinacia oleracea TaxID=3562 RepID=A0ABM3RIQ0_SPIOL|nr:uncharacterized protein LOC130469958 [Spinacia oleracea]
MKNHESHPPGSTPFPEANVTSHNGKEKYHANNSGRGRGQGRGRGHGYGRGRGRGRCGSFKNSYPHQKFDNKDGNKQEKDKSENVTNVSYRCGGKGHWSRTCRTPKHLAELYQQSLKPKGKKIETNLVYEDGEGDFDCGDTTHLEVADFLTTPEGNLRIKLCLTIREGLDLRLTDVVTAYLYGTLENDIYMKVPEGFKLPEAANSSS